MHCQPATILPPATTLPNMWFAQGAWYGRPSSAPCTRQPSHQSIRPCQVQSGSGCCVALQTGQPCVATCTHSHHHRSACCLLPTCAQLTVQTVASVGDTAVPEGTESSLGGCGAGGVAGGCGQPGAVSDDDFPGVGLADVAHAGAGLTGLEGREVAVGLGDTEGLGDVGVGARLRSGLHLRDLCIQQRHLLRLPLPELLHQQPAPLQAVPLALRVLRGRCTQGHALTGRVHLALQLLLLSTQLYGGGLVHGQLADGGHDLARDPPQLALVLVHLLGQLQSVSATLRRLCPQLVTQPRDLLQDQLLLQQGLLLVIQTLLQLLDLGTQLLLVWYLSLQQPPPAVVTRVLQSHTQSLRLPPRLKQGLLQPGNVLIQEGDLGHQLDGDCDGPLQLADLNVQQPDLILSPLELQHAALDNLVLYVVLLVQDAELVISVYEHDARVVPALNHDLVLFAQLEHLLLGAVDDGVQLVNLGDLLVHHALLVAEGGSELAQLNTQLVPLRDGALVLGAALLEQLVLGVNFTVKDVELIGEDAALILHLRGALVGGLYEVDELVALVLDQLVKLLVVAYAARHLALYLL
mmetsp:Transcript_40583/g.90204  ORF Transcript_40583/g.90204 Transcript_40583/m.90204 type:complete len:578 (+) Transcript_40583:560-2293(+)